MASEWLAPRTRSAFARTIAAALGVAALSLSPARLWAQPIAETAAPVQAAGETRHSDLKTHIEVEKLAKKAGVDLTTVKDIFIYGNHSPTMFPAFAHAKIGGKAATDVITDQAMPRMTGLELAERLATEHPALPVILASGHAELAGQSSLPRLHKPFDQFVMALAIKSAAREEAHSGQSSEA